MGYFAGYAAPVPGGEGETVVTAISRLWAIPLVTTLGGLASGLLVFKFAPEAEGHGTDAAINAFHNKNAHIRSRVPGIKMLASAITIGSGGSAGREGPVALIGAGFGSILGDALRLDGRDRRIALTVGIGAGIGSIFKAPLGGALLGTEVLYRRDFETDAIFPSFIASITGYVIFASFNGWAPIFSIPPDLAFENPLQLIGYLLLGLACGLVGMLYGRTFYKIRNIFRSLKVPNYIKPAIGGLGVGIIGMFLPQVLGQGYGWVQLGIYGNFAALPVYLMVGVLAGKIIATSLSIGSGGSGGVFAPGLVIGGMVGGIVWWLLKDFTLIIPPSPDAFVIVGMMALFGGIAKAPLAIMIMISEMTNSYVLLAPCMIAVVLAYFSSGNSYIYENQVVNRAASPAHKFEYSVPLLTRLAVNEAMHPIKAAVNPDTNLKEMEILMKDERLDALPVIQEGSIIGIVANLDIVQVPKVEWMSKSARDIMSTKLIVCYPYEYLDVALERMTRNNISHLPVLDEIHPLRPIGMLCLEDVIRTYRSHVSASECIER
ncbi:MAG: chloride channel protein [Dehalococcoidia bacterium]|nr:chloride channel protein [Dehalococcoidia bacterium]MDD5493855.1 chloride channel protein [Dehalococcoidia bacterium]